LVNDKRITLAVIAGAHGVTGEVRLKLFGEGVAALRRFRAFNASTLTLTSLRDDGKGGAIARFAEVTDRNGAEALRGTELTVPRSALNPIASGPSSRKTESWSSLPRIARSASSTSTRCGEARPI
jgi:16S rRNA processing protein RimM